MGIASTILKELGISEERAIRDYALLNASQRLAEYVQESQAFEKNTRCHFDSLQKEYKRPRMRFLKKRTIISPGSSPSKE